MLEGTSIDNWKVHPNFEPPADKIADYNRWIEGNGPHSKLGKFYRRQVAELKKYKPVWPEEVLPFVKPYSKEPEEISTAVAKKGDRAIGGFTEGSVVAYDQKGRMIADWETFWSDEKSAPTRRWEAVYDSSDRIVAERIVSGSHVGQFDGEVTAVTTYKYNEEGDQRHYKSFLRYPTCNQDHDGGMWKADGIKDGKPYWEVDQFFPKPVQSTQ